MFHQASPSKEKITDGLQLFASTLSIIHAYQGSTSCIIADVTVIMDLFMDEEFSFQELCLLCRRKQFSSALSVFESQRRYSRDRF